ncbi:MAG: hypothetical protein NZM06_04575 [Chloroherpetonaceae bacterium]|nr:hypothetical protein [Chloroherpetonaceae bacterium]MDW8436729.1 cytochrome c3 family protein [Chloroherpetonaceae bacterium]
MNALHARLSIFALALFFGAFGYAMFGEKLAFGDNLPASAKPEDVKPVALKDESGCFKCHSQLSGNAQVMEGTWAMDTHHNAGVSCVGCHGGNPDPSITMANWKQAHVDLKDAKGNVQKFIGKASRKDQVQWCGSCHENPAKMETYRLSKEPVVGITAEYMGSGHGRALFKEGNDKSASCVDCHGAHGAMKGSQVASLTYVKNIATMCGSCHSNESYIAPSLEKKGKSFEDHTAAYMQSVHAHSIYVKNAVGAPTCNGCHSNHGDYPSGVSSVKEACNTCHGAVAAAFHAGPHEAAYAANNMPGCISCHGSPNGHAIANWGHDKVGAHDGAQCANCHNANVPEAPAYLVDAQNLLNDFNLVSLVAGELKTEDDSIRFATQQGFYAGILYKAAPLETKRDSLNIASFFFRKAKYDLKLDTKQDTLNAIKVAPAILRYASPAKLAELKTLGDTLGAMAEIMDYAQAMRRYHANLRALGSATKDNLYLTSLEKTYKKALEFVEAREKKGDYMKPEKAFLEEFGTKANEAGTLHHVVRSTILEEKLSEALALRDSTEALIAKREEEANGRTRVFIVVGVIVGALILSLGASVSNLRAR